MNDECYFRDKTLLPGGGHAWQAHDHAVLTLVVHGRLDETFDRQEQHCPGWGLHYKPRGAVHSTSTGPQGARMFLVGLRGASLDRLEARGADGPRLLGGGARAARALSALLRIERACDMRSPVDREVLRSLWDSLAPRPGDGFGVGGSPPPWLREVRDRILSGEDTRARLSRVAAEFRVHPVSLARAFRKSYGCSIGDVRRRARTDRAVERLAREDTPLCDVAFDLGYADQSHFTREFRRETGWTPRRFRDLACSLSRPVSG